MGLSSTPRPGFFLEAKPGCVANLASVLQDQGKYGVRAGGSDDSTFTCEEGAGTESEASL